jgi:hypothetical protein
MQDSRPFLRCQDGALESFFSELWHNGHHSHAYWQDYAAKQALFSNSLIWPELSERTIQGSGTSATSPYPSVRVRTVQDCFAHIPPLILFVPVESRMAGSVVKWRILHVQGAQTFTAALRSKIVANTPETTSASAIQSFEAEASPHSIQPPMARR